MVGEGISEEARTRIDDARSRRQTLRRLEERVDMHRGRADALRHHRESYLDVQRRVQDHFNSGPRAEIRRERGLTERHRRATMQYVTHLNTKIREEEIMAKKAKKKASKAKAKTAEAPVPKKPKKAKKQPCVCGCGSPTGGYFAPGHDARLKGQLRRLEAGKTIEESGIDKSVYNKLRDKIGFDDKGDGKFLKKDWSQPNDVAEVLRG